MTQDNSLKAVQENTRTPVNDNTLTIDIGMLFVVFMRHIVLIMAVTILFGAISFFYFSSHTSPTYTSWFTGYVNNANIAGTKSDLSGDSLVSTYAAVITSKTALEAAAEQLGMDADYNDLKKMVSTTISDDTQIIYVYVTGDDANEVFLLANALASMAQEQVSRVVDGTSMRVMDAPDVPEAHYNVSITKNTAIGAILGFVLTYGVLFLLYMLDDRIRDDKTIEETLGLVVLGTIPDFYANMDKKYYKHRYYSNGYYGNSGHYGHSSYEYASGSHEKTGSEGRS